MKNPSPVLQALGGHYAQSHAGRTGRGARDVTIALEDLLAAAGVYEGEAREIAERQLRAAASRGLLALEPVHRRDPGSIARVRLSPLFETAFFEYLGELSPSQVRANWSNLFLAAKDWPVCGRFADQWKAFCTRRAEMAVHWDQMAPFRRGELTGGTEALQILARLLQWDETEHFIRAASCRICGDSKQLERQRGTLEMLLEDATEGAVRTFAHLKILETPRHVLAVGPLRLEVDGRVIELAGLRDGASLAEADLDRGRIETSATRCLTIENKTSFHQRALQFPGELLIHTSYPNAAVRTLLSRLPRTIEFLHWGDTDPTGFDILRELRESTGLPIKAFAMDYAPMGASAPLTPGERRLLESLLQHSALESERESLRAMVIAGKKGAFEQEARPASTH